MSITIQEAFKEVIKEHEGYAFLKLKKMFWQSVIDAALELTDGNKTKACEMLGISKNTMAVHDDRT